ncbi:MAG: hypothetical protein ACR2OL_02645 [Anderseniella sp.]
MSPTIVGVSAPSGTAPVATGTTATGTTTIATGTTATGTTTTATGTTIATGTTTIATGSVLDIYNRQLFGDTAQHLADRRHAR